MSFQPFLKEGKDRAPGTEVIKHAAGSDGGLLRRHDSSSPAARKGDSFESHPRQMNAMVGTRHMSLPRVRV